MPPLVLAILRQDLELVRLLQAKGADFTVPIAPVRHR